MERHAFCFNVPAHSVLLVSSRKPHGRSATADFEMVPGSDEFPASIHLLGIESPGLTASLAIAEEVENRLFTQFT